MKKSILLQETCSPFNLGLPEQAAVRNKTLFFCPCMASSSFSALFGWAFPEAFLHHMLFHLTFQVSGCIIDHTEREINSLASSLGYYLR